MSEVAGRIEIEVESDTRGFGAALKRKLQAITEGIVAEVEARVDTDRLKAELEEGVKKAANGVAAKIGVEIKDGEAAALRGKLEAVVKTASQGVKATVEVDVDSSGGKTSWRDLFGRNRKMKVDAEVNKDGLLKSWLAARAAVQADAKRRPFELPLTPQSFRSALKPIMLAGLVSLIQPLIATIGGALGGAAAMLGNLATGVQTLAAAPAVLGAFAFGVGALTMAFGGLTGKIEEVPPALLPVRREFEKLKGTWEATKASIQTSFWKDLQKDIRPVGEKVLPLLEYALGGAAKQLSAVAKSAGEWVSTPLFSSKFKMFAGDSNKVLGALGRSLLGWAQGLLNIANAASPLVERLAGFLDRSGKWAAGLADTKAESDGMAESFKYAGDKVSQLWEMTKDLAAGIAAVFRAGRESGDSLLGSLETTLSKWRDWAESDMGQKRMKEWFDAVEPIAREVGGLLVDVGKALGRMSEDPNVATMLRSIREDLLPTLERFLNNLGRTLGPEVIEFIEDALRVLTEFSEAGGPLARGLGLINTALGGLADMLARNPWIAEKLGIILGALLAYRALAFLSSITGISQLFGVLTRGLSGGALASSVTGFGLAIAGLTGSLGGLPGPMNGVASALGTFLLLRGNMDGMNAALATFRDRFAAMSNGNGIGGFVSSLGKTGGTGLRGALKGVAGLVGGALGGPVGIGLAVVSTAVGVWAQKHAETAAAAQAYKGYVDAIVASLEQESGALTEATRAEIAKKLSQDGLVDGAAKYGVALEDLTDSVLDNADAQGRIQGALRNSANEVVTALPRYGDLKSRLAEVGLSQDAFSAALLKGGPAFNEIKAKVLEGTTGNQVLRNSLEELIKASYDGTEGQREFAAKLGRTAQGTKDAQKQLEIFNQLTGKTREQVKGVIEKLDEYKGKSPAKVEVAAITKTAEQRLTDMGYRVTHLPNGKIVVTAATSAAEAAINRASRPRYATIYTRSVLTNGGRRTSGGLIAEADGGIIERFASFANGGIRELGNKVASFANGAEKHIAQIARPGEWRVWAEEETGGEAYIPLAGQKRGRSTEILREVADRFGYALAPRMEGLARGLAGGARAGALAPSTLGAGPAMPAVSTIPDQRLAITLAQGAVSITNPAPEPAGKSVVDTLRNIGEFGLGGA